MTEVRRQRSEIKLKAAGHWLFAAGYKNLPGAGSQSFVYILKKEHSSFKS
jgi:hypothetical protein